MTSPYMNREEAAVYLRTTVRGFDHWVKTRGVSCVRRGRIRLFRRADLDRVLEHDATRRSANLRKAG